MEKQTFVAVEPRIRMNTNIGLWTFDRPKESCVHKSPFCERTCYKNKLYVAFPDMTGADKKNEVFWQSPEMPALVAKHFERRKVKRLRLMSRGEAFAEIEDVERVIALLEAIPDVTVMIPTRAWNDFQFRQVIQTKICNRYENARVFASIDPDTHDLFGAITFGSGTLFYGNDEQHPFGCFASVKCPKTWGKIKGACKTCNICFGERRVHVHLKQH